jgi:hypothetical protein
MTDEVPTNVEELQKMLLVTREVTQRDATVPLAPTWIQRPENEILSNEMMCLRNGISGVSLDDDSVDNGVLCAAENECVAP